MWNFLSNLFFSSVTTCKARRSPAAIETTPEWKCNFHMHEILFLSLSLSLFLFLSIHFHSMHWRHFNWVRILRRDGDGDIECCASLYSCHCTWIVKLICLKKGKFCVWCIATCLGVCLPNNCQQKVDSYPLVQLYPWCLFKKSYISDNQWKVGASVFFDSTCDESLSIKLRTQKASHNQNKRQIVIPSIWSTGEQSKLLITHNRREKKHE